MYSLLKYSKLDSLIQRRMSNQAPNIDIRLDHINTFMQDIITQYNVASGRRSVIVDIIPDGTPIDIDTLILDGDCKSIDKIRHTDPDLSTIFYSPVDEEVFANNNAMPLRKNEWVLYSENGKRYLKINSLNVGNDKISNFKITYYTTNVAVLDGNFIPEVVQNPNCFLLIPDNYKELALNGILEHLWLISMGAADGLELSMLAKSQYEAEKRKLKLAGDAKRIRTNERRVNIHRMI